MIICIQYADPFPVKASAGDNSSRMFGLPDKGAGFRVNDRDNAIGRC